MEEYDNWYLKRILMNFNGDKSTYYAVKQIVVNNLLAMGVEASMDDGMTTLANKIKDIEPTIIVEDFDIDLTLNASSDTVYVGDTVTLSAHLTASYDTEDVDLVGDLQNATVSFYENNTLLGTATTNSNGVATYNYTTLDDTDLIFSASFDGTENFDEDTSNTVTVNVSDIEDYIEIKSNIFLFFTHHYGDGSYPDLIGTDMMVDYGDGITEVIAGTLYHNYGNTNIHTIKIWGVSEISDYAFSSLSIHELSIPSSITYMGENAFTSNSQLTFLTLNWINDGDIISYNQFGLTSVSPNLVISIPYGTTSDYVAKGYPSDKLVEREE